MHADAPRSSASAAASESGTSAQPDAVQSLWIGELSRLERLCMASFVRQGHGFHLYTYDEPRGVPDGVTLKDASTILARPEIFRNQRGAGKGSFAAFSDVFRYQLLLDHGGWWVDTDIFCLRPFDFAAPYVFGAEDKPVASGVMKVPRASELMRRCCEGARRVERASVVWNEYVDLLADSVRELGLLEYVLDPTIFSPILWSDIPAYVRGSRVFAPAARSYAVHLYNEMWRRNKLDKERRYPSTSVLEILARATGVDESHEPPRGSGRRSRIFGRLLDGLRRGQVVG